MTLLNTQAEPGQTFRIPEWTLADRLRKAREMTGLGQIEFAEHSGISRASVVNYETGRRVPRAVYLSAWALATGVPVEWLETGKAPVTDDEGQESRLSDLNRRPVLYKVAIAPFATADDVLTLIDAGRAVDAR